MIRRAASVLIVTCALAAIILSFLVAMAVHAAGTRLRRLAT